MQLDSAVLCYIQIVQSETHVLHIHLKLELMHDQNMLQIVPNRAQGMCMLHTWWSGGVVAPDGAWLASGVLETALTKEGILCASAS